MFIVYQSSIATLFNNDDLNLLFLDCKSDPYLQLIMVNVQCQPDGSCPYQYFCNQQFRCQHNPVFPLQTYPILMYCLYPIASAICNTSGNSWGQFKVLLLMDALNYSQAQATTLSYPLILGTALYNFVNLIMRRHPSRNTSLVDYNIVSIIIPNVLYGSTIGSIVNQLLPPIVADACILVLLIFFTYKFFLKLREVIKNQKQGLPLKKASSFLPSLNQQIQPKKTEYNQSSSLLNRRRQDLQKQLNYEAGYHMQHIGAIFLQFAIFEGISFLAQGKFIQFQFCTKETIFGMTGLTAFYVLFVFGVFYFTKKKMSYYKEIGYDYEYPLGTVKFFVLICLGSLWGGFNGGVFALGNTTTIMFTLITLKVEPIVVSATVGFQVIFSAAASLLQAIIKDSIDLNVVWFFIVITLVVGGILSFIASYFLNKLNRAKINKVLLVIIGMITSVSAISMVVNIILGYINFGSEYMISVDDVCKQ